MEHTQDQSPSDEQRAKALSLQKTRAPADVPGYEPQRLVGSGAYGEVWAAVDRNTGRKVAIKFYAHRRGVDWSLLSREVEKLVFLSADRYVVQLLEVGWESDPPYYVMEYIENGSLDDFLKSHALLPTNEAVELFREIAIGLAHAHGKGVLHCDLKPANILLDQDHRPRLADFGQSRLTTEQRPALGTLFFMAPEQADLHAVPDARWDVYALGAILHCLLVGSPPHRNDESISQLETAHDLTDRLARYRDLIQTAPTLVDHRRQPGVDKLLADIVDRCLAADPRKRFANVQEVLDALSVREEQRQRRPLVLLGMLGPILFLLVMAYFGWSAYGQAMRESEANALTQARERNRNTAELGAQNVYIEVMKYFDIVRHEADRPQFHGKLAVLKGRDTSGLHVASLSPEEKTERKQKFLDDPARRDLNRYLEQRLKVYQDAFKSNPQAPKFASVLVLNRIGTMLAAAYADEEATKTSVGGNFTFRGYFYGGPSDLPRTTKPGSLPPVAHPHLSAVFQSSTSKAWRVAVTTPIPPGELYEEGGVLVFTVNLGDFQFLRGRTAGDDVFPVLVDGRSGSATGMILQHPLFNRVLAEKGKLPEEFSELRVPLNADGELSGLVYRDPLGEHSLGEDYRGEWLAAACRVPQINRPGDNPAEEMGSETGLVVVVQEHYDRILAPIRNLGNKLVTEGVRALLVVVLVSLILWYVVIRWLKATPDAARRRIFKLQEATASSANELADAEKHQLTTLAATQKR